jgi:hypothetical protein
MIQVVEGKMCALCGRNEAVVLCNGCGQPLCAECRIFDIWSYGCGHGDAMVFCPKCNSDPSVNIWKDHG